MTTRLLVTGAGGMSGAELAERARAIGWEVLALTRAELDIRNASAVRDAAKSFRPDIAINAAAYTAVDKAESDRETAAAVNAEGARNVARAASTLNIPLIHISTDYVFDGESRAPYTTDSDTNPVNVYGKTKLAGENAVRDETDDHAIVRTSWIFSHRGTNFVRTMLRLASEREQLRVVDDQLGRPTSASDLADALLEVARCLLGKTELTGTYHFANAGPTTWYEFAQAIFAQAARSGARSPVITPVSSDAFPTAARRPRYSVLDTQCITDAFGVEPRDWRDALHDTLGRMQ